MVRLEYTRSTRMDGGDTLFGVGMSVLIFGLFQFLFFPYLWSDSPWLVVGCVAFELFVLGIMAYVAVLDIRCASVFRCRLDDEQIECVCPLALKGETFLLRLDDITCVEREVSDESWRWYLHGEDGNRYWLTSNYENPCGAFAREILKLRPGIRQIET